ncbi:hypothetical protein [Pyrococcus kukulkanii]|uniref:Uncharacterized protein n=1 Tax=Pyrococcus kukulkanii TaxID=1609559 RepID=A0A127B921_9EURY|nr:hypothetical protein [Pyrococcus kukulkanii]AMM53687.1 hypothetical protein TQ32_03730 [Pyrococcus kukulkanii]
MSRKAILALIISLLTLATVSVAADETIAKEIMPDKNSENSESTQVPPYCIVTLMDIDKDTWEPGVPIGIYAYVNARFKMPPCSHMPILMHSIHDGGDIPGAIASVFFGYIPGQSIDAAWTDSYGSGFGKFWHAHAEVKV